VQELRPGLWRWTTRHPGWEAGAEAESPADWPEEVGSVAYGAPAGLVLIDPLVDDETWPRLDELVSAHGKPVFVLTTLRWHGRSSEEAIARYGASTDVPAGLEAIPIERADETMFWLGEHRALVPGDRLLGASGRLSVCPESWLGYLPRVLGWELSGAELRAALCPLLDLPVELVLVSHGEPVLTNGAAVLERALAGA
jgi:hypothetical protein